MRPRLIIDLALLAGNYRLLADLSAPASCGAAVKAQAYGLDATKIAPVLHKLGCRIFFVHDLLEAEELAETLPDHSAEIYILGGLMGEDPKKFQRFIPVLNSLADIQSFFHWKKSNMAAPKVALHIDTGMSRLGLSPMEWQEFQHHPEWLNEMDWQLFMSHLACSDEIENPLNVLQWTRFSRALQWFRSYRPIRASLAASGGLVLGKEYHFDVTRPGAALYGIDIAQKRVGLQNVFTLEAPILQVRGIDAGTSVGYGASHTFTKPGRIAIIGIGYADGIHRAFGNKGSVIIKGKKAPIVGRVSMDLTIIDITHLPEDACFPGDFVTIFGHGQTIDEWAAFGGTIGYEMMTSIGARIERHYKGLA